MLKFWKKCFCAGWMPLYFGGDSQSQANTTINTTTQNTTNYADQRAAVSDNGVAVTGSGNTLNRTENTTFTDNSTKDSSTHFTDNSTAVTNVTTTDFGSVGAALSMGGTTASKALDVSGLMTKGALDSLNATGANQLSMLDKVLTFSGKSSANALTSASDVMGFAAATIDKSSAAFADAKTSSDNKTVIYVGLAVVAAVGLAVAMK